MVPTLVCDSSTTKSVPFSAVLALVVGLALAPAGEPDGVERAVGGVALMGGALPHATRVAARQPTTRARPFVTSGLTLIRTAALLGI
jgi:hypothetical protein